MRAGLTTIAFDADDTLWHTEKYFTLTQARFADLLADHTTPDDLMARLLAAERRNLPRYGFGIKGFVLSMIETALEITDDKVPGPVIAELIAAGHEMLAHPIELLPHAAEVIGEISRDYNLLLITKGDLLDQERKLAQSGLGDAFDGVKIVSDKTPAIYRRVFAQHGDGAARGMMVGDSMRSDVVPMIAAGGWAVHVPQGQPWELEQADTPADSDRFDALDHLGLLPELLRGRAS